jgi:hypothetical protein
MSYYNIDSGDGNELCAGLSEQEVARVAQRLANERGESVWYYQGGTDGEGEVESIEVSPEEGEDPEIAKADHAYDEARDWELTER